MKVARRIRSTKKSFDKGQRILLRRKRWRRLLSGKYCWMILIRLTLKTWTDRIRPLYQATLLRYSSTCCLNFPHSLTATIRCLVETSYFSRQYFASSDSGLLKFPDSVRSRIPLFVFISGFYNHLITRITPLSPAQDLTAWFILEKVLKLT